MQYDVAIVGGGPAGSTAGTLLKKYNPNLNVAIFEREVFPRDHVGESLLPPISPILVEMGVWDKVEAAEFPIKIGATYRWGKSPELWDFEFISEEDFKDEARPAKFEGQREVTAFQVDRAIYDEILLDHAKETGVQVFQNTRVSKINSEGDRITSVTLGDGSQVDADYFIDASGHSGIIRRAMGVESKFPTTLQNIAFWDYWQNAEWAVKIGVGGTRIQILSLGYGWLWFIPLGPTRTSVGLVIPVDYYKKSGKKPEQLYAEALSQEEIIMGLMRNATSEGKFQTTKDWSFISERQSGENWFLIGESAGFADPILSAGLTMAHVSAREAAFTILELTRGKLSPKWLLKQFDIRQKARIGSHIRFADYWYTANAQFKDLKEFTSEIAKGVGLDLSPEKAWQWIAQGGFIDSELGVGVAVITLDQLKQIGSFLSPLEVQSPLETNNIFTLDLSGANFTERPLYTEGKVQKVDCYERGERVLPLYGAFEVIMEILQRESRLPGIAALLDQYIIQKGAGDPSFRGAILTNFTVGMEALVNDGWIKASYDPKLPLAPVRRGGTGIHENKQVGAGQA